MNRANFVWAALVMSALLSAGIPALSSQAAKRNLKEYQRGPAFDLPYYSFPERKPDRGPLRGLLWGWWTTRTKGFSRVSLYTREGTEVKCSFFVEPDATGRWQIVSECLPGVCPYTSKERCRRYLRTVQATHYTVVERVAYDPILHTPTGPKRPYRLIPADEISPPLNFVLILKDPVTGNEREL